MHVIFQGLRLTGSECADILLGLNDRVCDSADSIKEEPCKRMAESDFKDLSTLHALLTAARTGVRAAPIALQDRESLEEIYHTSPEYLERRQEEAEHNAATTRADNQVADIHSLVQFLTVCVDNLGYADINLAHMRSRCSDAIITFREADDDVWPKNIFEYSDFVRASFVSLYVHLHSLMQAFSDDGLAYTADIQTALLGMSHGLRRSREVLLLTDEELDAAERIQRIFGV
jgi:hypothetical protein